MSNNPDYETIMFDLPKGIKIGGALCKNVRLREQTVGDIIAGLKDDMNPFEARLIEISRRILLIGNIENPGHLMVENLSPKDFDFILEKATEMDEAEAETEQGSVKKK